MPVVLPARKRSRTMTPLVGEENSELGTDDVIDPSKFAKDLVTLQPCNLGFIKQIVILKRIDFKDFCNIETFKRIPF